MIQSIPFSGIFRNVPGNSVADGACNELINLRMKDNVHKPAMGKKFRFSIGKNLSKVIVHSAGNTKYYLGYNSVTGNIVAWNANPDLTSNLAAIGPNKDIDLHAMGNTVIIVNRTDNKIQYLRNNNGTYTFLEMPRLPILRFSHTADPAQHMSGEISLANLSNLEKQMAVKAYYDKNWSDWEKDGYYEGYVCIIYAFELVDETYIFPSAPVLIYAGNYQYQGSDNAINLVPSGDPLDYSGEYTAGSITFSLYNPLLTDLPDFSRYKDIIKGISVFTTYPEHYHRPPKPEEVVSDATALKRYVNEDAKLADIVKKNIFYKTTTIAVENINKFINWQGKYLIQPSFDLMGDKKIKDLKTCQTYPVDSFSNHVITAKASYIYNDRLCLVNTVSKLYGGATPREFFGTNAIAGEVFCLEWELKTSEGTKIVRSDTFNKTAGATIPWPTLIAYPDRRATKFRFLAYTATWVTVFEHDLTPHEIHNFAYYIKNTTIGNAILDTNLEVVTSGKPYNYNVVNDILQDINRVQISEAKNPFVFPAKNSYQVGHSEAIDITSMSQPISQEQFGVYPLLVFCRDGVWALSIGQDKAYIDRISPFSGEVPAGPGYIYNTGDYIAMIDSDYNLKLLVGKTVSKISDQILYLKDSNLNTLPNFASATNHPQTTQISGYLCQTSGKTYIEGAVLGYNREENEVILANPAYPYSFVYNVKKQGWYKISESYKYFINDYPDLLGVCPSVGNEAYSFVHKMNEESWYVGPTSRLASRHIYLESSPLKLGTSNLKKINRLELLCDLQTEGSNYVSLLLYGSLDGVHYHYLTGKQAGGVISNLVLQVDMLSCKYYKIIVSGNVLVSSSITALAVDFKEVFQKLR